MTFPEAQKVLLWEFAVREAGANASLEQMKAICLCMRNRVRAGWHDGSWILVIENAADHSAHDAGERVYLDPNNRNQQRMLKDIDDIFYGDRHGSSSSFEGQDLESSLTAEQNGKKHPQKYWCFVNRPIRETFKKKIIDDPQNHASHAQMGLMMFFE